MNNIDINKVKANTISFNDVLNENLKDPEFEREWLRQTILEYVNDGNETEFFRALEQTIKARMSVTDFAKEIDMNRVQLTNILKGKKKTPNLLTINKILVGLGLQLTIAEKTA